MTQMQLMELMMHAHTTAKQSTFRPFQHTSYKRKAKCKSASIWNIINKI